MTAVLGAEERWWAVCMTYMYLELSEWQRVNCAVSVLFNLCCESKALGAQLFFFAAGPGPE